MNPDISVVCPVYFAEKTLTELSERLVAMFEKINVTYEIIYVDDRSLDKSWSIIKDLSCENDKIKGLRLSENFGQHKAIAAGLEVTQGNSVVVLDCDLQDVPEEIEKLYDKSKEGFEIVRGMRIVRNDSFLKRMSSLFFHKIFHFLSGVKMDSSISNFGVYDRKVIEAFNLNLEKEIFFAPTIHSIGFRKCDIEVKHSSRAYGKSTYTFIKLLKLALKIALVSTNRPLKISITVGIIVAFFSLLFAFYNVIARLTGLIQLEGFTSTIFSIWFVGALLLMSQGVLGLYLGSVFNEVKNRPRYFIDETVNLK